MAGSRKHRRKRWIKIETSLFREPWPPEVKLALVQLACVMNDRWAADQLTAEEACTIELDATTLMQITGKNRADRAWAVMEKLAAVTSISLGSRGEVRRKSGGIRPEFARIAWPKFAKTQSLGGRWGGHNEDEDEYIDITPSKKEPSSKSVAPIGAAAPSETLSLLPVEGDGELVPGIPPPDAPSWDLATNRLVNLLARMPGEPEAKRAWLRDHIEQITYKLSEQDRRTRAALCSSVIAWYRVHLRGDNGRPRRRPETFDEMKSRDNLEWLLKISNPTSIQ